MTEARICGLQGKALSQIEKLGEKTEYVHKTTLQRHVGDGSSLHQWCKRHVLHECVEAGSSSDVIDTSVKNNAQQSQQQVRVDEILMKSSQHYYEVLFHSVLTIIEEMAFQKLKPIMELQMKNGVKFGSTDKCDAKACAEFIDVLLEVVQNFMKKFIGNSKFIPLSGDASEARKTSSEKELVFCKILVKGFKGYIPCTFLLKCHSLKDFGGADAKRTFKAILDAIMTYISEEEFKQRLIVCVLMEQVNFGIHEGAIRKMIDFVDWALPFIFHCLNHRLELGIKDAYESYDMSEKIKEMLDILHPLFKNHGKSWRLFQQVGEDVGIATYRYTKVGGTRFQAHTLIALNNFIRNFLVNLLFVENAEEHGNGMVVVVVGGGVENGLASGYACMWQRTCGSMCVVACVGGGDAVRVSGWVWAGVGGI